MTPADPKKARRVLFYSALVIVGCLLGGVGVRRLMRASNNAAQPLAGTPLSGTHVQDLPKVPEPVALPPPTKLLPVAVVVDVARPDALSQALGRNAWLQEALAQPIGQGFFGQWLAFLRTRGDAIGASFRDTVVTFVAEQMLGDQRTNLVLFGGDGAFGLPVLVLPSPSMRAQAAFTVLSRATQRGEFTSSCPVAQAAPDAKAPPAPATISLVRWLIADRPVYATALAERIVIASEPDAVLQGACAQIPEAKKADDQAVNVGVTLDSLGREAQLLAALTGLGNEARIEFTVSDAGLQPRGFVAPITAPRLAAAPLPEGLLAAIPEDTPVFVGLQLRLPKVLTRDSLKGMLEGHAADETLEARSVALLWYPHGDQREHTSDIALIWPLLSDRSALQEIFSGANAFFWHEACGQLVLTSNEDMFARISATCASRHPSILHAAPGVVAGLREPTSLTLGVHVGRFLAKITRDAYLAEYPPKDKAIVTAPPEIEAAARTLLELPWIGLRGVAKDGVLQPGGFRS